MRRPTIKDVHNNLCWYKKQQKKNLIENAKVINSQDLEISKWEENFDWR